MREIAERMSLQNKRCKNALETSLVLLEVDRRKRLIEEIGGQPPFNDTLVNVLWMAMDQSTRSHISGKLDPASVEFQDMKQAILQHTTLVGATSGDGQSRYGPDHRFRRSACAAFP